VHIDKHIKEKRDRDDLRGNSSLEKITRRWSFIIILGLHELQKSRRYIRLEFE